MSALLVLLRVLRKEPSRAFLPLLVAGEQSWVFLGLQAHRSNLCLHLHVTLFPLRVSVCLSSSYRDTLRVRVEPSRLHRDLTLMRPIPADTGVPRSAQDAGPLRTGPSEWTPVSEPLADPPQDLDASVCLTPHRVGTLNAVWTFLTL